MQWHSHTRIRPLHPRCLQRETTVFACVILILNKATVEHVRCTGGGWRAISTNSARKAYVVKAPFVRLFSTRVLTLCWKCSAGCNCRVGSSKVLFALWCHEFYAVVDHNAGSLVCGCLRRVHVGFPSHCFNQLEERRQRCKILRLLAGR